MSGNTISDAFESVDVAPSAAFRQQARAEFLAALVRQVASDASPAGDTVPVVEAPRPGQSRRLRVVFGIAASVVIVAALAVVAFTRRSEPTPVDPSQDPAVVVSAPGPVVTTPDTVVVVSAPGSAVTSPDTTVAVSEPISVDTSRDAAVAESALLSAEQIGVSWAISHQWDAFTSRKIADVAASVPACADYVDFAFDSPRRDAPTAGRIFTSSPLFALTQWVYIFPTEAAATEAMDKIAEPGFVACFSEFMDTLFPQLGSLATTTPIDALPLAAHGDRQVVLGQSIHVGGGTQTVMNAFVQVGRGIVYVNPTPDSSHDSLDPAGRLDTVLSAASANLADAVGP
jgi:hypothetical protein